jgi:hypothetical protein
VDQLFTKQDTVCDACWNKKLHPSVRSAVDGIVEEYEIPISAYNGDVHVFMHEHERDVMASLERAIDQHG